MRTWDLTVQVKAPAGWEEDDVRDEVWAVLNLTEDTQLTMVGTVIEEEVTE